MNFPPAAAGLILTAGAWDTANDMQGTGRNWLLLEFVAQRNYFP